MEDTGGGGLRTMLCAQLCGFVPGGPCEGDKAVCWSNPSATGSSVDHGHPGSHKKGALQGVGWLGKKNALAGGGG